jgi:hypothetical protein
MNAKDIDRIASAVVANLAGGGTTPLGCGSITNTEAFESGPVYACSGGYDCGGLAAFTCPDAFTCVHTFDCPGLYTRDSCQTKFDCQGTFGACLTGMNFSPCVDYEAFEPCQFEFQFSPPS